MAPSEYPVPFFFKLTHFLSVFGVTPWYNFERQSLVRPGLFKYYASTLLVVLVSSCIGLAYVRYYLVYDSEFSIVTIFDIILDVESLVAVCLPVMGTCFWNMHTWTKLYQADALTSIDGSFVLKHGATIFVLGNLYLLSLHHVSDLVMKNVSDLSVYYISSFVLTYYEFLIAFVIVSISALIKTKYICANKLLVARESKDLAKVVREVRMMYLKADEIVEEFNKLFGWPLLLIFFDFVLDILSALIYATCTPFAIHEEFYSVEGGVIIINCFYLLQSAIWLTAIIFCCDSVVRETDELLTNCYRLEQTLPLLSKELEELDSLKKLIKNKSPKLTAAGFFEIRRSTLLSLLSTTTTYFIVALQFNSL